MAATFSEGQRVVTKRQPKPIINLDSNAAAHEIASQIVSTDREEVKVEIAAPVEAFASFRSGCDWTEIRLCTSSDSWLGSTVSIRRPERDFRGELKLTALNWSSSGSEDSINDARATARLLAVACDVAAILNDWAISGRLARVGEES